MQQHPNTTETAARQAGPLNQATLVCGLIAGLLFGLMFLFFSVAPHPAPGSPLDVAMSLAMLAMLGLVLASLATGITAFCTGRWVKQDVIGVSVSGCVILGVLFSVAVAASMP